MNKILFGSFLFLLSACSMEASITSLSNTPKLPLAKSMGLISGSSQMGTAGLYHVQSSVGSYTAGVKQQTSDGEYYIYSSVQGAMVSN